MSYAHTSVNSMSKVYLQNERRYNYTTPKSYLEQISLYGKLITQKFSELHKKVSRLENGLDKLRSTAAQVDELKSKLAIQEIELMEKNEAADKLIEVYSSGYLFRLINLLENRLLLSDCWNRNTESAE